ncbi:unnamed protein product [Adineta steineri]|uniref:ABC transporter domain-containing protein n=1 Tax=Adineta steineri TaxID=433720 RepID=A0A815R866_9BILA|nr:unnamed protein product [Adineta steineri]
MTSNSYKEKISVLRSKRVSPVLEHLPVETSTTAITDDNVLSNIVIQANDDGISHHRPSKLQNRRDTRVSMDLTSKGTLSFHNIRYVVGERRKNCYLSCIKLKSGKKIINNVSGIFTSGMNAIMGPTGCGKSSLLDVLADRKDPHGLSGQIFVDGCPPPPSFKYIVGYVVQDDIISGTLTVRENLMFSANVRLPADVTNNERQIRVTKVIQDLGLELCADTKMGTEFLRGVSGGERKRTCIGMELVLEPKILFLDEPTTGLDSATARNVMECLKVLSETGHYCSYDHVPILSYINSETDLTNNLALFSVHFPNIHHLNIHFPFHDNFWSCLSSLKQLTSIEVRLLHTDIAYFQLQKLLNQACHLYSLNIYYSKNLSMRLFTLTSLSIRRLDFIAESTSCVRYFNHNDCNILINSPLGRHCEILIIGLKNRASIVNLINAMPTLRSLICHCKDDEYTTWNSLSVDDELIEWLRIRLPLTYEISRNEKQTHLIRLWIDQKNV